MNKYAREIDITNMDGVRIGHAQNEEAKTGVTVLFFPNGATTGCDVSGGGPASRENQLTSPVTADNPINAIVLAGGSSYGLAAADGVMRCLEENNIGYDTRAALVPLVCQSDIYDLGYGKSDVRPDSVMGYEACEKALNGTDGSIGNVGGGCGATVGKLYGMKRAEKSGYGTYAVQLGDIQIGAAVIVNALGDIYDPSTGSKLAGLMNSERTEYVDTVTELCRFALPRDMFTGNTTIGAIITNGNFNKAEMNKIAAMATNGYARCINPVGTLADGDTIYAASTAKVPADINLVGTLAAEVMERAIIRAVKASKIEDEIYLKNCIM